ncbi:MAG: protein kinase, partial [Gemmataceae bacterium]
MPIASVAELIDALQGSKLFDKAQLDELNRLRGRHADVRALARDLMDRKWLTPYQANQILQGNIKDLELGNYIVLERLGTGGMGQVLKALHRQLKKVVALKVMRREHVANPEAIHRFRREIRVAGQLGHPNIVLVLDADQVGDKHFFAMEFVDGIDLSQRVRQQGPLPIAEACDYIRQAAEGLQHAQERGMVHRDIKPGNLLLTHAHGPNGYGQVKLLDMGLARVISPDDDIASWHTQEGKVLGTPDYMAPEQALKSSAADVRADLYSLGCTFYYLLTGSVPFPGGSLMEKLLKHRLDDPEPIEKIRPEVPQSVRAIIRKLLAKKPEDRFQTPAELVAALKDPLRWHAPAAQAALKQAVSATPARPAVPARPVAPAPLPQAIPVSGPAQAASLSATSLSNKLA